MKLSQFDNVSSRSESLFVISKLWIRRKGRERTPQKPRHFFGIFLLGFTKKSQQPSTCSNSTAQSNSTAKSGQTMIEDFQTPTLVVKAEIVRTLKVVMSQFSLRPCLELNDLFKCMFPDSQIVSKFSLSKTKYSYIINFGWHLISLRYFCHR